MTHLSISDISLLGNDMNLKFSRFRHTGCFSSSLGCCPLSALLDKWDQACVLRRSWEDPGVESGVFSLQGNGSLYLHRVNIRDFNSQSFTTLVEDCSNSTRERRVISLNHLVFSDSYFPSGLLLSNSSGLRLLLSNSAVTRLDPAHLHPPDRDSALISCSGPTQIQVANLSLSSF